MRFAFVVCAVLLLVGVAFAQQSQPATISIQLSDVDITEALTTLSQKGNVSILGDATVKGKVSCSLSGVTAEQALDTLCKMNKLEWYRTYTSATSDASASKLFKLMDALKELGGAAVICTDPKSKTQTVFVPNAEPKSVDTTTIANGLKMKEVYLVRAIPDPAAKKDEAKPDPKLAAEALGDPAAAATQLYNYFQQMPMEQRFQTMDQLRHQMFSNMSDAERDQMRQWFRDRYGDRGRDGRDGRPGN